MSILNKDTPVFFCPLPLLRRLFVLGVLSLEARLACAAALRPALKVLVTVVGSTLSGRLLIDSWESGM